MLNLQSVNYLCFEIKVSHLVLIWDIVQFCEVLWVRASVRNVSDPSQVRLAGAQGLSSTGVGLQSMRIGKPSSMRPQAFAITRRSASVLSKWMEGPCST